METPGNLKDQIAAADERLLAGLGYKQEFLRAFTPLEVRLSLTEECSPC